MHGFESKTTGEEGVLGAFEEIAYSLVGTSPLVATCATSPSELLTKTAGVNCSDLKICRCGVFSKTTNDGRL